MSLDKYRDKRDFKKTPEPGGYEKQGEESLRFVVQKHAASHLHYDFRLELDGVLKSWAVPKGPSLDPSLKRLAMMVEDHPVEYGSFEGEIPKGNYGAGKVIVWDEGTYRPYETKGRRQDQKTLREGLEKGDLKFVLNGRKLKGAFALVRIRSDDQNSWLLIKKQDAFAGTKDVTLEDHSVLTDLTLEEVGRDRKPTKEAGPEEPEPLSDMIGSAPPAPMPHQLKPMLATLTDEPFDDEEWIFEIKQDGYRTIAEISEAGVSLYSRNNISFDIKFAPIRAALEKTEKEAVFDGEVVILDMEGRSSFQLLQNYNQTGEGELFYYVFDLLYYDGRDLRGLPLLQRKNILQKVIPDDPHIRFSDHVTGSGRSFFHLVREKNLEGVIAKLASGMYQTGKRSREWLKIKTKLQQEAIICGFTAPRGSRKQFGALVLGAFNDRGNLVHIGHSGGGFDETTLQWIHRMLIPLVQPDSPFAVRIKENMPVTWVKPVHVCEVSFSEWTDEQLMRQPVFLALREDKDPREVRIEKTQVPDREIPPQRPEKEGEKEVTVNGRRLKLSNLDKVFWPEDHFTKRDVIEYYRKIAKVMLPHLKDRPESLFRTPNGIHESGFFQKEIGEYVPEWVATRDIFSESNDKNIKFLLCQDEATLVYMANLGCIEINPWLSRVPTLDNPDYFVIDLDPEDIPFEFVVETARGVREVLEKAGAPGYPKTSGATGIHIYVPLGAKYDYDTATAFAKIIATLTHNLLPSITSIERSPRKRQKKVYLDYLQNRRGQTLAAPYSIRPRKGATVSTPLRWEEVAAGLDMNDFTISTIHSRIDQMGDLFEGVLGEGIDIERCLENLETI